MSEIVVREYEEKDLTGVKAIYTDVLGIDEKSAEDDIRHHQAGRVSKIFVAEQEGKIVGAITFYWQEWNMVGHIGIIGVSKEAQGKGVGRKLIENVVEFARGIKIRKIYVDTSVENKNAQIFYIKTGFYPEHIMKDYYKEGEDGIMFAMKIE